MTTIVSLARPYRRCVSRCEKILMNWRIFLIKIERQYLSICDTIRALVIHTHDHVRELVASARHFQGYIQPVLHFSIFS